MIIKLKVHLTILFNICKVNIVELCFDSYTRETLKGPGVQVHYFLLHFSTSPHKSIIYDNFIDLLVDPFRVS